MNIFFCINNAYVRFAAVTILSILENNQGRINFYVLNCDINEKAKKHLKCIIDRYSNASIEFVRVGVETFLDLKLNIEYISLETYFRYIIADLFPNMSKCLYLDADLIVNGDLRKLYDTDIDNFLCAGSSDMYVSDIKYAATLGLAGLYINAGVILFNLDAIRKEKIVPILFENTKKMKDIIEYQDQDIINITFHGRMKEVDSIYNFASSNVAHEKHKRFHAIIIHYTGPIKPWSKKCRNGMRFVWRHYCDMYMNLWGGNVTCFEDNKLFDNFGFIQKITDYFKWVKYKSIKRLF